MFLHAIGIVIVAHHRRHRLRVAQTASVLVWVTAERRMEMEAEMETEAVEMVNKMIEKALFNQQRMSCVLEISDTSDNHNFRYLR